MRLFLSAATVAASAVPCLALAAQTGNPGNNPLLGKWGYSSGGIGKCGCAKVRTFAKSQTFKFRAAC